MRDIKFRGMDIDGRWFYGNLAVLTRDVPNGPRKGHYISNSVGMPFAYQVRPETVGQLTGLKDKNGVEIYEGDIVQEHHAGLCFEADFFQLQVVTWESFGYMPFQRVIGGTFHDYALNLKEYIVAGNIYENPHLLEATHETPTI